jgi:hypothetical protein
MSRNISTPPWTPPSESTSAAVEMAMGSGRPSFVRMVTSSSSAFSPGRHALLEQATPVAEVRLEDLVAGTTHHLVPDVPGQLLRRPVEGRDPPLVVDREDPVGDVLEDQGHVPAVQLDAHRSIHRSRPPECTTILFHYRNNSVKHIPG